MCNAWNHSGDCRCGFGPPYPFTVTRGPRVAWHQNLPWDEDALLKTLHEAGLDPKEIRSLQKSYRSKGFPYRKAVWNRKPDKDRNAGYSSLERLFLRFEEAGSQKMKADIPIFILHSPKQKRGRVSYSQAWDSENQYSWSIKVFGFGTGASQTFYMRSEIGFVSKRGRWSLVHLPVVLSLTRLKVIRGLRTVGRILRVEVAPGPEDVHVNVGVRPLNSSDVQRHLASLSRSSELFPLGREPKGSIVTYKRSWKSQKRHTFGFNVNAFGLTGQCSGEIRRGNEITLQFELPTGYDHKMHSLLDVDGVAWVN